MKGRNVNSETVKLIQEMVDLETTGWNTKNPDLFLSMIHPDMAWPWPPTADAHVRLIGFLY